MRRVTVHTKGACAAVRVSSRPSQHHRAKMARLDGEAALFRIGRIAVGGIAL
jgi:hypothetical protein